MVPYPLFDRAVLTEAQQQSAVLPDAVARRPLGVAPRHCPVPLKEPPTIYLIGSLRNPRVPELAARLRSALPHAEVFDDWHAAGFEADDHWKTYEQNRGRTYQEALKGHAARNVFQFDKRHLDRSTHVVLVLPAGKSGHMEAMYAEYGVKANTAILLDPEDVRWDVMYQFIPTILDSEEAVVKWVEETR